MQAKRVLPIVGIIMLLAALPAFALFYPDLVRYFQMKSM